MAIFSMPVGDILNKLTEHGQGDALRGMLQCLLQGLINIEAEERIGAGPHERSESRVTQRNGYRVRELETRVGELTLNIPKLREGSYFPSLLQPRRRTEQALLSVIQEAYVHGVSTRKVDELVQALGLEGLDKSKVSRVCKELSTTVQAFRTRPLEADCLYLWLDATYIKVRVGGRVQNQAFIVAVGLNEEGEREVLGFTIGHAENYETWLEFLRSLVARGLGSPLLVISDAHEGLKKAIQAVLAGSTWQRCRVHFMRNVLSQVPKSQQAVVTAAMRQIFQQADQESALSLVIQVASKMEQQLPKIAAKLRDECHESLAYMAFPVEHWKQIHSTNGLERLNREIKRRSDTVGIFPSDESGLRLIGSILQEQDDEWRVCRRVYSQESIKKALALRVVAEAEVVPEPKALSRAS